MNKAWWSLGVCVASELLGALVWIPASLASAQPNEAEQTAADSPTHVIETELRAALRAGKVALSAEQAVQLARTEAPSVARARFVRERAKSAAARKAVNVMPRLSLSAAYTRLSSVGEHGLVPVPRENFGELAGADPGPGRPSPFDVAVASVFDRLSRQASPEQLNVVALRAELAYPVSELFLSILPAYRESRAEYEAEVANEAVAIRTVALEARTAYFEYVRARALVFAAEASVERRRAQLHETRVLVAAGDESLVELTRAEANVAAAEVDMAEAAGKVAVARAVLAHAIHRRLNDTIAISDEWMPAERHFASPEALLQRARVQRPEMRAMRSLIAARSAGVSAARQGLWPDLELVAGVYAQNPAPRVTPQTDRLGSGWDVGAVLRWSPTAALASSHARDEARAELAGAGIEQIDLEDALALEIARSYEEYIASKAALRAARTGISAAEESYRVRRAQLRAQMTTSTSVIDAELELRQSFVQLIDAALNTQIAAARLDYATGEP